MKGNKWIVKIEFYRDVTSWANVGTPSVRMSDIKVTLYIIILVISCGSIVTYVNIFT